MNELSIPNFFAFNVLYLFSSRLLLSQATILGSSTSSTTELQTDAEILDWIDELSCPHPNPITLSIEPVSDSRHGKEEGLDNPGSGPGLIYPEHLMPSQTESMNTNMMDYMHNIHDLGTWQVPGASTEDHPVSPQTSSRKETCYSEVESVRYQLIGSPPISDESVQKQAPPSETKQSRRVLGPRNIKIGKSRSMVRLEQIDPIPELNSGLFKREVEVRKYLSDNLDWESHSHIQSTIGWLKYLDGFTKLGLPIELRNFEENKLKDVQVNHVSLVDFFLNYRSKKFLWIEYRSKTRPHEKIPDEIVYINSRQSAQNFGYGDKIKDLLFELSQKLGSTQLQKFIVRKLPNRVIESILGIVGEVMLMTLYSIIQIHKFLKKEISKEEIDNEFDQIREFWLSYPIFGSIDSEETEIENKNFYMKKIYPDQSILAGFKAKKFRKFDLRSDIWQNLFFCWISNPENVKKIPFDLGQSDTDKISKGVVAFLRHMAITEYMSNQTVIILT